MCLDVILNQRKSNFRIIFRLLRKNTHYFSWQMWRRASIDHKQARIADMTDSIWYDKVSFPIDNFRVFLCHWRFGARSIYSGSIKRELPRHRTFLLENWIYTSFPGQIDTLWTVKYNLCHHCKHVINHKTIYFTILKNSIINIYFLCWF